MANLSQSEIDALLDGIALDPAPAAEVSIPRPEARPAPAPNRAYRLYDFRRPEKLSKDQMRLLRSHFGLYSRKVANYLANKTRASVDASLVEVDQTNYRELFANHGAPMVLCAFSSKDGAHGVLKLNQSQVFAMVDRLMGGSGQSTIRPRPLTEFERSVCIEIFGHLLQLYTETHQGKLDPFEVDLVETDDRLVPRTLSGDELMVRGVYDLRLGQQTGYINLYLPLKALSGVLESHSRALHSGSATEQLRLPKVAGVLPLEVLVELGQARLLAPEVAALRPGSTVILDQHENAPLLVRVGGVPRFCGRPGLKGQQLAVRIEGRWEASKNGRP